MLPFCDNGEIDVAKNAFAEIFDEKLQEVLNEFSKQRQEARKRGKATRNNDEEAVGQSMEIPPLTNMVLDNKELFEKVSGEAFHEFLYDIAMDYEAKEETEKSLMMFFYAAAHGNKKATYTITNMAMEGSHYFVYIEDATAGA